MSIVNLQLSVKPELRADFLSQFGEVVSITRAIDACNLRI
jgi:quinol monooxygenase YgiN